MKFYHEECMSTAQLAQTTETNPWALGAYIILQQPTTGTETQQWGHHRNKMKPHSTIFYIEKL